MEKFKAVRAKRHPKPHRGPSPDGRHTGPRVLAVTGVRRLAAWAVHLYTASGAVCAFFALEAASRGSLRAAFLWLAAQVAIDSSDGALARLVGVKAVLPDIDGNRLDDIVDYLAYVFVPAVIVVTAGVVPAPLGWVVAAAMLLSSAFGFSSAQAKTATISSPASRPTGTSSCSISSRSAGPC